MLDESEIHMNNTWCLSQVVCSSLKIQNTYSNKYFVNLVVLYHEKNEVGFPARWHSNGKVPNPISQASTLRHSFRFKQMKSDRRKLSEGIKQRIKVVKKKKHTSFVFIYN